MNDPACPARKVRRPLIGLFVPLAAVLIAAVPGGELFSAEAKWVENWEGALETARKEKKDLLVDFTGSDWCGWCIRLDREVFTQDAFAEEAPKHYVLVKLDFPQRTQQPAELRKQNQELSEKFGVQGFPTLFVLDSAGRPYGTLGYMPGGPKAFLGRLEELRKEREKRDEHFAKAKEAEGKERAKHLDHALSAVTGAPLFGFYDDSIDEIVRLDAENELGLKNKYHVARELHGIEEDFQKAVSGEKGVDLEKLSERIEKLLEKTGTTGKDAQNVYFFKARLVQAKSGGTDYKGILENVKLAHAAAPETPVGVQMKQILENARAQGLLEAEDDAGKAGAAEDDGAKKKDAGAAGEDAASDPGAKEKDAE